MNVALMTVPIITGMARRNAEEARLIESFDPIRAGFEDFKAYPKQERARLSRHIFNVAAQGTEAEQTRVDTYVRAVARAVVSTAASTGLTELGAPLLYRATKAHVRHEVPIRVSWAYHYLGDSLRQLDDGLDRRGRRDLARFVRKDELLSDKLYANKQYSGGEKFLTGEFGWSKYVDAITVNDTPTLDELASEFSHEAMSAEEVVFASLGRISSGVAAQVTNMSAAIDRLREVFPDLTIPVEQA